MKTQTGRRSLRSRGTTLVYISVGMVAFVGLASMAVDIGHVWLVRDQLQFAADAAARYASTGLSDGTAVSKAVQFAGNNSVDGTPLTLQNSDVVVGTWSNGTFTAGGSPSNAVQVTAVHTAARGNPVKIWWGTLIGKSSCDLTKSVTAKGTVTPVAGFIGFSSVTVKNNTFVGSYSSKGNKNPNQGSASSKARLGSNGSVDGGNNSKLQGSAVLGSSGSLSGIAETGSTVNVGSSLPVPTLPTWAPVNPTAYTVSSNTTLPGGTYWYTSLTINANLTFSGPAIVYVNGNVIVDGTLAPASGVPGDLTIYQYGSHSFGDASANGMNITANVIAPNSDFAAKNNLTFYGEGLFNSITTMNNAEFYYDTDIGPADGSTIVSAVQ